MEDGQEVRMIFIKETEYETLMDHEIKLFYRNDTKTCEGNKSLLFKKKNEILQI